MAPAPVKPVLAPISDEANCYLPTLQEYNWNVTIMLAIEKAESQCNPTAVGVIDYDGLRDYGVLQIHGAAIFNPADNIAAAYRIWQKQGYGAWTSYKTGYYTQYE